MLKKQLIELVRRDLVDDKRFGDRTIELNISLAWNQIVREAFTKDLTHLDRYCREYTKISVETNSYTGQKYSTLPEQVVQTIDIADGIRRINTLQDMNLDFVPMTGMDVQLLGNVEAGEIFDSIGYYTYGSEIRYFNIPDEITQVKMALVVPFEKWPNNEHIPIPSGTAERIVGYAKSFILQVPYVDIKNRKQNIETK